MSEMQETGEVDEGRSEVPEQSPGTPAERDPGEIDGRTEVPPESPTGDDANAAPDPTLTDTVGPDPDAR